MVDPLIGSTLVLQCSGENLRNDSADFARSCRDTVSGGSITSRENFTGDDESGGVRTEVLEEVAETVKGEKSTCRNDVVAKSNDREKDCKNDETHELDRFTSDGIHGCDGHPVAGNQTGAR